MKELTNVDVVVEFLYAIQFVCDGKTDYKAVEAAMGPLAEEVSNEEIWHGINRYKIQLRKTKKKMSPAELRAALLG